MILSDFDEAQTAIINPEEMIQYGIDFPEIAISTFSDRITEKFFRDKEKEVITYIHANRVPVYRLNHEGLEIAVYTSKVGAPASVIGEEQLIALGAKKLIYFGSCGVLEKKIRPNEIIIPTHAVRDEGTSYHYLGQAQEIELDSRNIETLVRVLNDLDIPYYKGKTWTTDAIYRETEKNFKKRREQGVIAVEMECSALTAVAKFRGISFVQFLYGADNLDSDKWDPRVLEREEKRDEQYIKIALGYADRIK